MKSVEVHDDAWWRLRWEAAGLVYSEDLTQWARQTALKDQGLKDLTSNMRQDHLYFVGQHLYLNAQAFINPLVASLPEHAHLFAEVSTPPARLQRVARPSTLVGGRSLSLPPPDVTDIAMPPFSTVVLEEKTARKMPST